MTSPHDQHKTQYSHINGPPATLLDRLAVSELCKGWPMYRDNSEWANFRSLFTPDAVVWTTWSTACPIDTFVTISQAGKAAGAFIMHRENGTLVELNASRAIGKMKATITQRFRGYDVDCDCRYIFFCVKEQHDWRIKYVKIIYEKDKLVPVDGKTPPTFSDEELARYPAGYRYLGAAQARTGHDINLQLATLEPPYWQVIYACMERWLAGEDDPGLAWETCET